MNKLTESQKKLREEMLESILSHPTKSLAESVRRNTQYVQLFSLEEQRNQFQAMQEEGRIAREKWQKEYDEYLKKREELRSKKS